MTREQAYDEKIAPLMAKIIETCKEHHIPLHADFGIGDEDNPTLSCTTHVGEEWDKSAQWRMYRYLSKARDNIDAFLTGIIRDAKENGHSSIYLRILEHDQ